MQLPVLDGIYDVAEGQYRLSVQGGRVIWTAVIVDGDAEDYLCGARTVARPMTVAEVLATLRLVLTAESWAQALADAMGRRERR
jgi:hypothetical protein